MNRFPDKKEWDKITEEAFNSESVHEFSESYNRKKEALLSGAFEEKISEDRRRNIKVSVFAAVCAASAGLCIAANLHTRIPEGNGKTIELSVVSESENIEKDNYNDTAPAVTTAFNTSETADTTEVTGTQPSVSEVQATEIQSSYPVSSDRTVPAVTTVSENKPSAPVTSYTEPEKYEPAPEITESGPFKKEELEMRKELTSALALLMAYSSAGGGVIHASDMKHDVPVESEIAVYIDENKNLFDFDSNGKFDVKDIYALYSYFNKIEILPDGYAEKIKKSADVTSDNMVTYDDLDMFIGYALANIPEEERLSFYSYYYYPFDIIIYDDGSTSVPTDIDPAFTLDYGSEEFQCKFYNVMCNSYDEKFAEPVYHRFCEKADSGEISLDADNDGKTDMTDMYKLYLYTNWYDKEKGTVFYISPEFNVYTDTELITVPVEVYDLDKIASCVENINKHFPELKTTDKISGEIPQNDIIDIYKTAFRYFLERNDISEEYLNTKTYEDIYKFEYGDKYLSKHLTLEESFLNFAAERIEINTENSKTHNLVSRADGLIFELFDDHAEVFSYRGEGGKIIIPSEAEGLPVTAIREEAMKDNKTVTEVVLPDTVTKIGKFAFSGCSSLCSVNLHENITEIGAAAFGDCIKLTEIVIPDSVTVINDSTFLYCTGIRKLVLPEGLKKIDGCAFQGCNQLTDVVIPDGVEYVGLWAFGLCEKLESVTVPKSVTTIDNAAFTNDFTDINTPPYKDFVSSVTIKGYAGSEAEKYAAENNLKFIDIENPETLANQPKPTKQTALSVGDINGDGKADLTDLSELSLFLIKDKDLTVEQQAAADVDRDSSVMLADLAKFRQYLSKQISSLG